MKHNQHPVVGEDPLAGDVDSFVHPDETRSDQQIGRDEQVANRLHMSGDDGADNYWNDYDEYYGTVNGGESVTEAAKDELSRTTITYSERMPGIMTVTTPKGRSFDMVTSHLNHEYLGMSHDEIGQAIDNEEDGREAADADDAAWDAAHPTESENAEYINGHLLDEDQEDPLAGDVDRWVDPEETKGH